MCEHPIVSALHAALLLTALLLLALLLLGTSLQLGWRHDCVRWPHHALFFAVCAGVAVCLMLALRAGQRWWALLPVLGLLLSMPRTRPGRANHWQRALMSAVVFALGVLLVW